MSLAEPFGSPGPVLGFSPLGMDQRGYLGRRVHTLLFLCLSEDPPLSSALTPRKLGKRPVSRGSTGPPRRGRLWLCLPHNPHLSWNPRDSPPSGAQGPRAMPHSESQETTRPRPNATALTGKLRPRERGHSLCPLGPQRPLRAPCRGGSACVALATEGGLEGRTPAASFPRFARRRRQAVPCHFTPSGRPRVRPSASSSRSLGELGGDLSGGTGSPGTGERGARVLPSRHQWLRLPTLHRGH